MYRWRMAECRNIKTVQDWSFSLVSSSSSSLLTNDDTNSIEKNMKERKRFSECQRLSHVE